MAKKKGKKGGTAEGKTTGNMKKPISGKPGKTHPASMGLSEKARKPTGEAGRGAC